MGAGLALAIRNKWPKVYPDYCAYIDEHMFYNQSSNISKDDLRTKLLGQIQLTEVDPSLIVCNMFAQYNYGNWEIYPKGQKQHFTYNSFYWCLNQIAALAKYYSCEQLVYLPYKIGCGLAGGNWKITQQYISRVEKEREINFIICKKGN